MLKNGCPLAAFSCNLVRSASRDPHRGEPCIHTRWAASGHWGQMAIPMVRQVPQVYSVLSFHVPGVSGASEGMPLPSGWRGRLQAKRFQAVSPGRVLASIVSSGAVSLCRDLARRHLRRRE
eukprot:1613208-Alexandrium_andersonii.AAC.1